MPHTTNPLWCTAKAAGDRVGLTAWDIKERCEAGLIEFRFDGTLRLVNVASLDCYIASLPTLPVTS